MKNNGKLKKYNIGYTQGTFDLFHIGHLNLLNNAKKMCDYLIVGVNSDELVINYKKKIPVINETDRLAIVSAIKGVNQAFIVSTLDKVKILNNIKFDVIFIGDDWKGNQRWNDTIDELKKYDVDVVFLPHTDGISTTEIGSKIRSTKL